MAFTSYSTKDAGGSTQNFRTVSFSSVLSATSIAQATAEAAGTTPYYNLDVQIAGSTVKASAGQVYGVFVANLSAAIRYLKFYNKTSAASSDTPVFVIAINANQQGFVQLPPGVSFSTAIGIRGTTGRADNDNTAPTAGDIVASIFYA